MPTETLVAVNLALGVLTGYVGSLGLVAGLLAFVSPSPAETRERQEGTRQPLEGSWVERMRSLPRLLRDHRGPSIWTQMVCRWKERPYVRWVLAASLALIAVSVICSEVIPRAFGPAFRH